jgi:hypothetical protein
MPYNATACAIDGPTSTSCIDTGDTGFVLICTALVWFMTPGLAFFYGGLVREKNFLNTLYMNIAAIGAHTALPSLSRSPASPLRASCARNKNMFFLFYFLHLFAPLFGGRVPQHVRPPWWLLTDRPNHKHRRYHDTVRVVWLHLRLQLVFQGLW